MMHHFHFAIPYGASLEDRRNVRAHILKTYGIDGTPAGAIRYVGQRDYGRLYVIDSPDLPAHIPQVAAVPESGGGLAHTSGSSLGEDGGPDNHARNTKPGQGAADRASRRPPPIFGSAWGGAGQAEQYPSTRKEKAHAEHARRHQVLLRHPGEAGQRQGVHGLLEVLLRRREGLLQERRPGLIGSLGQAEREGPPAGTGQWGAQREGKSI